MREQTKSQLSCKSEVFGLPASAASTAPQQSCHLALLRTYLAICCLTICCYVVRGYVTPSCILHSISWFIMHDNLHYACPTDGLLAHCAHART